MYQFLRHQELYFPEKKPSGAELERKAAFSSMNWFETVVKPLFVFGFGFCPFEGALCSQTDSGLLATSFTDMEKMSGLAGRALGWGLRLAGAGRLLPRCLLLHWVTMLSTAVLCMDTRPGPSCSANQQHASALGALEQPTRLSLRATALRSTPSVLGLHCNRGQRHFPFRGASECSSPCSHLKAEHS